jgi:hypothetical protein
VSTVLVQIGSGVTALLIIVGVTVAFVCFCCGKGEPKVDQTLATQQEVGDTAPITPFGPLPYVPDKENQPEEIELKGSPTESLDLLPSNPYDGSTI